jgi:hypothetical protein
MPRTIKAIIDNSGQVRLLEDVPLAAGQRALVTLLDDRPEEQPADPARLSEPTLAEDWNRPEEDAAWAHLQPAPSS